MRIGWGKHGSATAGLLDAYATGLSMGLRRGVPLDDLLRPGLGAAFAPSGPTSDPDILRARSVVDCLARRLAMDWRPYRDRAGLGAFTASEQRGRPGPSW